MSELKRSFVARVKAELRYKKISRSQLATLLGVYPSFVSQLLDGCSEPTLAVVERVANALRVSPNYLLSPYQPSN